MKKKIIVLLCFLMFTMVIGYSALSTSLKITGTGNIASNWNVYFDSITTSETVGGASNASSPIASGLTVTFNYNLTMPGDKIVYKVVLKNGGNLDAVVSNISAVQEGTKLINYSIEGIKKGTVVSANSSKTITITVEFDPSATSLPGDNFSSLEISVNCIQNSGNISSEDLIIDRVENTLVDGTTFSKNIKNLANNTTTHTYNSLDNAITYIGFYEYELPGGYTLAQLEALPSVSVSSDNSIKAYNDNGRIYIYSKNPILANASMYSMFRGMQQLTELYLDALDTSKVTSMQGLFKDSSGITHLDLSSFDTSNVTTMLNMFQNCTSLKNINLSSFNTSKVTVMEGMFSMCSELTDLNLNSFDTSSVTNMSYMFNQLYSLTNLNISHFDTSKVTKMSGMFYGSRSLTALDLQSFNTSKVDTMSYMFYGCTNLKNLNLSNFNTSNVTNMGSMFQYTTSLSNLDVSNFNTSKVTSMNAMFAQMSSIIELDLKSFNTSKVTNMYSMFKSNNNLKTIYVSNLWNTSSVTNSTDMFYSSSKLIGGNGTKYSSSYTDKTYARVDTASTPGYLTYKGHTT